MAKQAVLTIEVEPELRERFLAAAEAADEPAEQLLSAFMRDYVRHREDHDAHDRWFREEVEAGLREADDPTVRRIPHEEACESWDALRGELATRIAGKP